MLFVGKRITKKYGHILIIILCGGNLTGFIGRVKNPPLRAENGNPIVGEGFHPSLTDNGKRRKGRGNVPPLQK